MSATTVPSRRVAPTGAARRADTMTPRVHGRWIVRQVLTDLAGDPDRPPATPLEHHCRAELAVINREHLDALRRSGEAVGAAMARIADVAVQATREMAAFTGGVEIALRQGREAP